MGTSYNPKIITNNLVLNIDPANIKSYPASQDTYINNVSLMLDGESLNDSSQNGFTITNSNVTVSSAQYKYGNSSLYFNGTTSYLSLNGESAFSFGTGDFTIETWYYPSDTNTEDTIYDTRPLNTNSSSYFTLRRKSDGSLSLLVSGIDLITGGATTSSWQHVALCRSSGTTRLFLNGTQVGSSTFSLSYAITAGRPFIGAESYTPSNNTFTLTGYLDNFRVTKAARYTANFTPPAGPLPLPGRVTDLTRNKAIGSFLNTPTYSSTRGGIINFAGAAINSVGAGISIPYTSIYDLSTADFTIEAWCYPTASAFYGVVIGRWSGYGATGNTSWCLRQNDTSKFQFAVSSNGSTEIAITDSQSFTNSTWYHLVGVRSGTSLSFYKNGVLVGTTTAASMFNGSASVTIGHANNQKDTFTGSISNCKIYK